MKKCSILIILLLNCLFLNAQVINDAQVIQSGHWIYDSLYLLGMEQKITGFYESAPLCVGELKFYFKELDYEKLSDFGKNEYKKIEDFLYGNSNLLKTNITKFDIDLDTNLEFYYKSNKNIDWSFNYNYKDNFLTVPVKIGISNYIAFESDPFLGKNYYAAKKSNNFINIPFSVTEGEFLFPRFTYGGAQYTFNNWGVNFYIGKEGLQIGHTQTGSIIYNDTFETDSYVQLSAFTHSFKYIMDVIQISSQKFFYIHQIEVRPIKSLKLCILEGSILNDDFELRYLNPLMVMHSYASWIEHGYKDYDIYDEDGNFKGNPYWECNFCAYLGFLFDWNPFSNLRIYGLYAENELRLPNENNKQSFLNPTSIGIQLGSEYKINLNQTSYLKPKFEGVWTSPYLYIKQEPGWSMYRKRIDNIARDENGKRKIINSWVGTPLGPDTFALQGGVEYNNNKLSLEFDYLFLSHGENNISIFDSPKKTVKNSNGEDMEIYDYYPMAGYISSDQTDEDYEYYYNKANNLWLSGIIEYKNQIVLKANYKFNQKLETGSQIVYTFVFNNNNIKYNFEHGFEISLYGNWKIF